MKILAIITLTIAMLISVLSIQAAELRDGHPDIYTVKKGDTLWDISAIFLEKPTGRPATQEACRWPVVAVVLLTSML